MTSPRGTTLRAVVLALLLVACGDAREQVREQARERDATRARSEITSRLRKYTAAARAVDADASSSFFTDSGTLFEPGIPPIVTREAIADFVRSFPGVQVDSAMARADTVEVHGSSAIVWGTYFERLRFPGQPESAQHGRFVMQWLREQDGEWRINRYYRIPLPANWAPPSDTTTTPP